MKYIWNIHVYNSENKLFSTLVSLHKRVTYLYCRTTMEKLSKLNIFHKIDLIYRVGYRVEKKSGLWKKKSKIAHHFFVTKATDLKTIFLKSPWNMHVETCVTLWDLFKTKIFFSFFCLFLGLFFNPCKSDWFVTLLRNQPAAHLGSLRFYFIKIL